MTIEELQGLVTVWKDEHQLDVDTAYESYQGQHISEPEYHNAIIQSGICYKFRIATAWKRLSVDDQLTYYLGCDHQAAIQYDLTDEQKAAIIIIQDKLVIYD